MKVYKYQSWKKLSITIFTSYSNSDDQNELNCIEKYNDILTEKAFEYNKVANTLENCISYKNALEEYISKTESCPNNATIISSFKYVLENLDCNYIAHNKV